MDFTRSGVNSTRSSFNFIAGGEDDEQEGEEGAEETEFEI